MDRRFTELDQAELRIEQREDGGATLKGYAAVFYRASNKGTTYEPWPGTQERIAETAFLDIGKDDVRALFNHDPNMILGRNTANTLRLSVDSRGLKYEIDLPNTSAGKDVAESIRRGDITGSSFAFKVHADEWRMEKDVEIRTITRAEVFDVGPVTYPAYKATTAGTRAQPEFAELRSSQEQFHKRQEAEAEQAAADEAAKIELAAGEVEVYEYLAAIETERGLLGDVRL